MSSRSVSGRAIEDVADLLGMTPREVRRAISVLKDDAWCKSGALDGKRPAPQARPRAARPPRRQARRRSAPNGPTSVLDLMGELRASGFTVVIKGSSEDAARARTMHCEPCGRRGLRTKALASPGAADDYRTIAYCPNCKAAVVI